MKIFVKRSMKFGYFSSLNTARRCVCLVVLLVVQAVALFADNCIWRETTAGDIKDGDEVVITMYHESGYTHALPNAENTSSAPDAIELNNLIIGNEISSVSDYLKWKVKILDGYYVFYSVKDATLNLYCNQSDNGVRVGNSVNAQTNHEFTIDNNCLKNKQTSRYLAISYQTKTWRSYTKRENQTLKFYKKVCIPDERNDIPIVEWKTDGVIVMYNGTSAMATIAIGNTEAVDVMLTQKDHAIYELPIETIATSAGHQLSISIGDKTTICTIPYIISSADDAIVVSDNSDLVVLDGGKYNATNQTLRNVTIYGGGALIVNEGTYSDMNTLTMRIGAVDKEGNYMYAYPQLLLKGTLQITSGKINLDYLTTYDRYYSLALPYAAETKEISYPTDIYGENVSVNNTGSFALQYYDGAARAASGKGWRDVDEPATLQPYQGYTFWGAPKKIQVGESEQRQRYGIHRIPMKISTPLSEDTDKEISITAYAASRLNDMGWNYLGNPYLAQHGSLNTDNGNNELRYVTTTWDGKTYESLRVQDVLFEPFNTFFVQAEADGTLLFERDQRSVLSLANRHSTAETDKEIATGIVIVGKGQTDRTGLLIADGFTDAYEVNADLAKFENEDINIYTIGQIGKLAFMAEHQSITEEGIALGYSVSSEGSYTIAFDNEYYCRSDIHALYLIDYDCNVTTDLLKHDYSFATAVGTYDNRFGLQVSYAPNVSTDIDNGDVDLVRVESDTNGLKISNLSVGSLVTLYDLVGHVITSRIARDTEMYISVQKGHYIVHITSDTRVMTTNTFIQ